MIQQNGASTKMQLSTAALNLRSVRRLLVLEAGRRAQSAILLTTVEIEKRIYSEPHGGAVMWR